MPKKLTPKETVKKGVKEIKKEMENVKEEVKKFKNELTHQVSYVITPEHEKWDIIRQLQESGKLPLLLYQVLVYTKKRQYERGVMEMEHIDTKIDKILEVKLKRSFPYSISPKYEEIVKHYTCYNPYEGRLHVLLEGYGSLKALDRILQEDKGVFTPLKFSIDKRQRSRH